MTSRPGPRDQARESARARRATEAELFKELEVPNFLVFFVSFCQVNNMFTSICPSCPTECKLDLISDSCDQRYNAAMQQSHIQNSNVAQPSSVRCGLKRDKKSTNKQFRCCLGSLGTMGTLVETRPLWSSLPRPSSKPNRCPNRQ